VEPVAEGRKSKRRNVVLSEEEDRELVRMMEQTGFTRSVLVRLALREFLKNPPSAVNGQLAAQLVAA
jgi:hypothetical protein